MEQILQVLETLWNQLYPMSIFDIIDILIMALVIYKVISLVRRSSSGAVVKGIFLVIVVMWIAQILQLNTVKYLLEKTLEWGVVALVILFQPEIRRFLEQMGRGTFDNVFRTKTGTDETEQAIMQTVMAYTDLSKSKTGALMVFERNNMLDDAIKTGTPLDCAVSSELLKNLFWNKAPMHDGAVIVRGGRIVGAGCMLPLSGNVNLSRELGMRHRAGIGVSEQTDAVVATVSEETGSISVAVGGMLKRHLTPETLERLLRNELMPKQDEGEGNKSWLGNRFKSIRGEKHHDGEENNGK